MTLSFKFLSQCNAGNLLRVKIGDVAEFAIVGEAQGYSQRALVVLKDAAPPFAINVLESGHYTGDFETFAALVYGKCDILPDHSDYCEIGVGPLFTKAGALILGDDDAKSLVVASNKTVRYFDFTSWELHGEPGGQRAAFKTWSLWHDGVAPSVPSVRLLGYSVE